MYSGGAGSQLRLSFWSEIYFCWCCPGLYLPRECPTPGSVPPHLQYDPYNLEVSGRAFSAGNSGDFVLCGPSREAGLSPTTPGAACLPTPPCVLLSLCMYHQQNLRNQTPGLARYSLQSLSYSVYCLWKMESNLVYRSLRWSSWRQPLRCCWRTVLEGRVPLGKAEEGKKPQGWLVLLQVTIFSLCNYCWVSLHCLSDSNGNFK